MFAFIVLDLVFQYLAKRLAGKNFSEIFCQMGVKILTQLISHILLTS